MYYDTKQGDDELYHIAQATLAEENEESDDDGEPKNKKSRKRRRTEATMLEQENETDRLSNSRPKRAAGTIILITHLPMKFILIFYSNSCW